jgi:type IV pilus assembly protein PilB
MKLSFGKKIQRQKSTESPAVDEYDSIPGLSELYFPDDSGEQSTPSVVNDIIDALLNIGAITAQQHKDIRQTVSRDASAAAQNPENVLLKMGLVTAEDILKAKASMYGMEFQRISPEKVNKLAFEKLDPDFIRNNNVVPVDIEQDCLLIATSEPANVFVLEDVKRQTKMDIKTIVCTPEDIENICSSFSEAGRVDYNVDELISDMGEVELVREEEDQFEDLERMAGQSPVIKFVNYLISNAIHDGASDIHIEPKPKFTKIRYRIDGVLFETMQSPLQMHPAIVSRIKIMSNLDISERRLPQDGKISVIIGGANVDLRVSVLPTSMGEKVVIRILESKSIMRGLEQLGMEPDAMETFKKQITMPHGIFLVTGPTGSGKSTTLYSAMSQMDGNSLNISTVEDPVEYKLDFCNQVQTREKIGLTFASALRSLLRQDPDIIMVGEIRDNETARIAVQAALTGHLVLSTLHTNDAPSSITRLVDIGIEPYLISASLNGVLAQRLVRKICPHCKQPFEVPEKMKSYIQQAGIEPQQLMHGVGCDKCRGSGYIGRIGIYEMLVIDENYRSIINEDHSVNGMRRAFCKNNGVTLFDDGINKVKKGITTMEEVLRVTEMYGKSKDEVFVENIS